MQDFASVMDGSPLPVYAVNEDGYCVYINEPVRRFLGYERTEIIGKPLTDLVAYVPRLIMASFERLKRQGHLSGRARYRHADGSLRNADVNIFGQTLADQARVFVSLVHPLPGPGDELPELLETNVDYGLTDAEMRLLYLIAEGFSDQQIAVLLQHTSNEVAQQVQGALAKMNAASRTEAAVLALKKGVVL